MKAKLSKPPKSQPQPTIADFNGFGEPIVKSVFLSSEFNVRTSESGGAVFDMSGNYRYLLWRNSGEDENAHQIPTTNRQRPDDQNLHRNQNQNENTLLLVMLNPNKADESRNDPTIRRCIGFAQSWGFSRLEVVNLFAICAEKPRMLRDFERPIGLHNDEIILQRARLASALVVAWGTHGTLLGRDTEVLSKLKSFGQLKCFGTTKNGMPRHPLYVRADFEPCLFRA